MYVPYKNYVIKPATMRIKDENKWSTHVFIVKNGNGSRMKDFHANNTFDTKEDAEKHCVIFAQQIIDGKHKDLSLEDL